MGGYGLKADGPRCGWGVVTLIRRVAPGEELQGPGSGGSAIPSLPCSRLFPGPRSPGSPPSCGGSRSGPGPAEGRRCDSPPLPLPASVSPRARRRRLPSSRLPLDSSAGRSRAPLPSLARPATNRPTDRPTAPGAAPRDGARPPGRGDQPKLGCTGAAAATTPPTHSTPALVLSPGLGSQPTSPPAHQPGWQPSTAFPKVLSACRFNPEYPQACTSRHGVVAVTSQSIQALLQLKSKSKFKSLPQVDLKINPTLEASSRVSHHHHRPGPVQCHDFRTVTATVSPAPGNHRCFQGVLLRNVTSSMG